VGTHGAHEKSFSAAGLQRPSGYIYQHERDYWGIGGKVIALVVGAEAELHPLELADALAGLLFIDFLRDDVGHTRGLDLSGADEEAMNSLIGTLTPKQLRKRMRGEMIEPPPAEYGEEEETEKEAPAEEEPSEEAEE
jgi:hypothetical protein